MTGRARRPPAFSAWVLAAGWLVTRSATETSVTQITQHLDQRQLLAAVRLGKRNSSVAAAAGFAPGGTAGGGTSSRSLNQRVVIAGTVHTTNLAFRTRAKTS